MNRKRYVLPVYESDWLLKDQRLNPDPLKPVRYVSEDYEVGFWRKVRLLVQHRKWVAIERRFRPVYFGSPGYEGAPYESQFVLNKDSESRVRPPLYERLRRW